MTKTMKQKINLWGLMLSVFVLLVACNDDDDTPKPMPKPIKIELSAKEAQVAKGSRDMAMKFLHLVAKEKAEKQQDVNFMISPYSLNAALSMLWNGAREETKTAIGKTLGLDAVAVEDANAYYKKIAAVLLKTDPSAKIGIANSIWYKKTLTVNPDFQTLCKNWYDAEVEGVDFSEAATVERMNKWCSDKTNGLIKDVFKDIPQDVVMYLMNALYFKGIWSEELSFDKNKTEQKDFTLEDKSKVKVAMMQKEAELRFVENDILSAVELPYGNGAYSMVLMLPKDGVGLLQMFEKLSEPNYFSQNIGEWKTNQVTLALPKFKVENKHDFKDVLVEMGMGSAFDKEKANLKGLFSSELECCVSKVNQFTSLEVDEKGAEAAAVTVVEVSENSLAVPSKVAFLANRPFAFVIKENSTDCVLFSGKIGNPSIEK